MTTTTAPRGNHLLAVGISAFTLIIFRKLRSGLGMLRRGISVNARHHTSGPKGKQRHRDKDWQTQPSVIDELRELISAVGPEGLTARPTCMATGKVSFGDGLFLLR